MPKWVLNTKMVTEISTDLSETCSIIIKNTKWWDKKINHPQIYMLLRNTWKNKHAFLFFVLGYHHTSACKRSVDSKLSAKSECDVTDGWKWRNCKGSVFAFGFGTLKSNCQKCIRLSRNVLWRKHYKKITKCITMQLTFECNVSNGVIYLVVVVFH